MNLFNLLNKYTVAILFMLTIFACNQDSHKNFQQKPELISFASPWTSAFIVDSLYPHHFVNNEGEHLLILNKTAWAYFKSEDPEGVLKRAKDQGVNVIRVCLEGALYFETLGMDSWPWGGTRENPDFSKFNEPYWDEVERRIQLAGKYGIGIDLNLYNSLSRKAHELPYQKEYWDETINRLGKYSNIFTWEIMNEYLGDERFQDSVGNYFYKNDPFKRPVITSAGTTDDACWPQKEWMGISIVHTCTGSTAEYDLKDWYFSVAQNSRSHGKPAFNNESGREIRHKNDDPIHRRKQAWIWYTAGCHWTWHSWEGCEGIDDASYRGPGQEFMKPVTDFFRSLPFWEMDPNFTIYNATSSEYFSVTLAEPSRKINIVYLCSLETGKHITDEVANVRLPNGGFKISFINPSTLDTLKVAELQSKGLGKPSPLQIPDFMDDLAIVIERTQAKKQTVIEGTE
ncbi:DUF4038 domain-containing protein [Mariniflexile sp. HMF6888]|uniref:apiosidase-like domain-containing protein n=1 Tax=Mariniflexile sp. HMF6888 TaxID=3373086 RepID=UPI00378CE291